MDRINRDTLIQLANVSGKHCVSLYMPTHPAGRDGEQDAIRLKGLLKEAESELVEKGMRSSVARDLIHDASEVIKNTEFWKFRSRGLAAFIAEEFLQVFRLDKEFHEEVTISNRFHLRPLMPLIEDNGSLYVLALSENKVNLFHLTEDTIEPVEIHSIPNNMQEWLNTTSFDRGSQVHSAGSNHVGNHGGKSAAVFHGQGGKADTVKEEQIAFCSAIDEAICKHLNHGDKPVMLAGVDSLTSLYRRHSHYKHLLPDTLAGNHDYDSLSKLRTTAWDKAQEYLHEAAKKAAETFGDCKGTQHSCEDPVEILKSLANGRVRVLFYEPKAELFGRFDVNNQNVEVTGHEGDADLIDTAAIETIRHGGKIYSMSHLNLKTNSPLAAIYRY